MLITVVGLFDLILIVLLVCLLFDFFLFVFVACFDCDWLEFWFGICDWILATVVYCGSVLLRCLVWLVGGYLVFACLVFC